jgi:HEPN domain-containing protein
MADDYKIWLARAKSSLALSGNKTSDDVFYEDLCFQAQQAVEKALKALILYLGKEPDKTHNIVTLIKCLPWHINIPETVAEAVTLNDYAVQTRYPGDYTPIDSAEHENAVKIAGDCIKWVSRTIEKLENKAKLEQNQPALPGIDSFDDA